MTRKKKPVPNTETERNLLHRFIRSRPYLTIALVLGVGTALFFNDEPWLRQALVGWNVTVWLYLLMVIPAMNKADHHRVREIAARQDESAVLILVTMTIGIALTMAAVISELSGAGKASGAQASHYIFTGLTVLGSWILLGVVYCFHYAHIYYNSKHVHPELKFPDEGLEPNYWDFLYFSFTISVAVQTSDVAVMTRSMRKLVLGHSVIAFLFNLLILGLSVNIAAGLMNN